MGQSMSFMPALRCVRLSNNSIGSKGAKAIVPSLAGLLELHLLDMSANSIGDKGVKAMQPFLTRMTALKDLNLGNNRIGESLLGFSNVKGKLKKKLVFVDNLEL